MHYHGKLSGANQPTVTAGASKTSHTGHAKMETKSEKITERGRCSEECEDRNGEAETVSCK